MQRHACSATHAAQLMRAASTWSNAHPLVLTPPAVAAPMPRAHACCSQFIETFKAKKSHGLAGLVSSAKDVDVPLPRSSVNPQQASLGVTM